MNRTESLILAGASVRSLAESAKACGVTLYCVDMFRDVDLQVILRENEHPAAVQIERFSEIPAAVKHLSPETPLIWVGGLENHPRTLRQLRIQHAVLGSAAECLNRVCSVTELRRLVTGSGCDVPEILTRTNDSHCADTGEWLIKPRAGSGGLGIRHYQSGSRVRPGEFLQRYVPGRSLSVLYHQHHRITHMLGACVQISGERSLGAGAFQFCGNVGPVQLPESVWSVLREVGFRIAATNIQGVFGADFIIADNGIWLIEINPRITASHELYDFAHSNVSVLQRHLQSWFLQTPVGVAVPDTVDSRRVLARLIVYVNRDGVLSESDSDRLLRFSRHSAQHTNPYCWLADIPAAGSLVTGQPFCSVYHVLTKRDSGRTTVSDAGAVNELNGVLSGFTGVEGLDTGATAIRYASLFGPTSGGDNDG